jgi:hypothetical protein
MTYDESMESRVEQPEFFRAPSNIQDGDRTCGICAQDILPGEQIALTDDDQYLHRGCFEMRIEDQREVA